MCWSHQGVKHYVAAATKPPVKHTRLEVLSFPKHYPISTSFSWGGHEITSFIPSSHSRSLPYVSPCAYSKALLASLLWDPSWVA